MTDPSTARRASRFLPFSAGLWILCYFTARGVLELRDLGPGTRIAAAVLPVAPFAWFLWTFIGHIRAADELERRIHLEALAVAFPVTMLLLMTLGLLQLATTLSMDDWSYRHVWAFLPAFYLGGLALARRRYQ